VNSAHALAACEAHIWRASLQSTARALAVYWDILSMDERARADRFRFASHRRQFIVSHAVLRLLLAIYSERAAGGLEFEFLEHGKPVLKDGRGLAFNMAHSRDLAAYIICRNQRVGIDVEWMQSCVDFMKIARDFFSPAEREALEALPAQRRAAAFYAYWTRKEAYIKARGDGLSLDLRSFTVALDAERAAVFRLPDSTGSNEAWTLGTFDAGACYSGAFAVEGEVRQWRLREWDHGTHA
jgi:4'-phosphopantetheinyl transferase